MELAEPDLAEYNRTERLALAELLAGLDDRQLDTQSLCDAWRVREVLAHLVTPYLHPPLRVVGGAARHLSFGKAMQAAAAEVRNLPIDRQLEALRASADGPFVPPMLGLGAPLTDAVVHGEDIRVPLGIERTVPPGHLRAVLDFGVSWRASPVFIPWRRLAGIRFSAPDIDWSAGHGELVEGRAQQLVRAMYGRSAAATGLGGDGVEILASRYGGSR